MERGGFIDLVIGGPDISGTSTQVADTIEFFDGRGLKVRDVRGTEIDALFHTNLFKAFNRNFKSLKEFKESSFTNNDMIERFLLITYDLLMGGQTNQDLKVASMIINEISAYIDPNSADVWIMEEPTKRGAGQVNRVIEQNRSAFGNELNPIAAAETHSVYRTDEFLRFRRPLRESGKIIIRSRSEESACYQILDKEHLPNGVSKDYYFNLAGHKIAFANPPTHIFIVCGPENWTEKDYLELKKQRSGGRFNDDHERNARYQVLVNQRYASSWLEDLYLEGCDRWGGDAPKITRFNIYDDKPIIKRKMSQELEKILGSQI